MRVPKSLLLPVALCAVVFLVGCLVANHYLKGQLIFNTRNGEPRLRAWWIPAESPQAPLLVLLYGIGDRAESMLGLAAQSSKRGFACLCPDNLLDKGGAELAGRIDRFLRQHLR